VLIESSFECDAFVYSGFVNMDAECGRIDEACESSRGCPQTTRYLGMPC